MGEPTSDRSNNFEWLDDFLDALAAKNIVVDVEQRVRLIGLLLQLSANQRMPEDPDALCRLVTPILVGSPTEQLLCETTFKSVFSSGIDSTQNKLELKKADQSEDYALRRRWSTHYSIAQWLLVGAITVLAMGVVYYGGIYVTTLFGHHGDVVTAETRPSPVPRVPMDIKWIKDYPIDELDPPKQSPWNRSLLWYYTEYDDSKWAALLLPWGLCFCFLVWLYYRMLAYLRRERLKEDLRTLDLRFADVKARFGDRKMIGTLQPLRDLARTHILVLDHERTAVVSAQAAGQLKPQFKKVAIPTNFIVLIDRRSPRDHLADYSMAVAGTLREAGITVELLEFNGEPTLCHFVRMGEFIRLGALVRRFPDSIFLIFAAVEQLIDPTRERLLPEVFGLFMD
jgi:hypothetical protein